MGRTGWLVIAVALVGICSAAAVVAARFTRTRVVTTATTTIGFGGQMRVFDSYGHGCTKYSDIGTGTTVTVRDGVGAVIGGSSLEPGDQLGIYCTFRFAPVRIPTAGVYRVEVAHRGETIYNATDVVFGQLFASVTLGS